MLLSPVHRACDLKIKTLDQKIQGSLIEESDAVFEKKLVFREIITLMQDLQVQVKQRESITKFVQTILSK